VVARNAWLAIAADSQWVAQRALKMASPRFEAPVTPSRDGLRRLYEDALESADSSSWFSRGDYDSAIEGSRPLAATYRVAPAQHLGLEPLTATARFEGGRLEVWAATQAPDLARARAAEAAGAAASHVTLYPMPAGEPGGRAVEADAIPLAVELARELKRPVQLSLSPSASQNSAPVAPGALARIMALPGAGGITTAWKMRIATSNGLDAAIGDGDKSALGAAALGGAIPPYSIADLSIDAVPVTAPFRTGYLRGHPQRATAFFIESFIDELAHAAGLEPLAFRMAMLGGAPRLARCIQAATAAGGWDGGGRGSTQGIAACSAFGSHIGLLADATIGADQSVEVHRLVAAVDCGRIVNPQLVRQQIEGGLIWALGLASVREPDWAAGMPRSRPIGAIGLPRIARTPEIRVELIPSNAPPGGVSGLGVVALAPAVANAIYAATGKRLRNLPFDTMSGA
jgi:isoquinoline 1-oxidoreductase beta subunit